MPTHEQLRRVFLAFEEVDNALGECVKDGLSDKSAEALQRLIYSSLGDMAVTLDPHDLGGAMSKAAHAFDEYLTP